ncbi:hypothetical protein AtNW77_MTg0322101 (mitochondrion) [Arabidopsis thaliana]
MLAIGVPPASLKKLASSPIPISFLVGIPFVVREYQRVGPLSGMQEKRMVNSGR